MRRRMLVVLVTMALVALSGIALAEEKPYEGLTLRWLTPPAHNSIAALVGKKLAEEKFGIDIELIMVPGAQKRDRILRDWKTETVTYDIVTLKPRYNGEFMGGDFLYPMNEYLDKFNSWDTYNHIIPTYRKLYTEWAGKAYAFVQDGDVAQMYYLKEPFENPAYKEKFKEKYGYELRPPETLRELFDVGEFFNGWDWDHDGKPEYGLQMPSWRREDMEVDFLPLFGDEGGVYFDKNMNPLINSPAGVRALENLKKILSFCPPGSIAMSWSETMATFLEGEVAIALWYPDIGRLIFQPGTWGGKGGPHWLGKIGYGLWPATRAEGTVYQYASMCHGRITGVTKFSKHKEAAFKVLEYLNRPEHAIEYVANAESGADPMLDVMADKSFWDKYNFTVEKAYLDTHLESMKYGFPELQLPGNEEYYDIMRAQVHAYLTGAIADPKVALDEVAKRWREITKKYGIERQKKLWEERLKVYEEIGMRVPR
jgi:multiple sugar transport system substrate-binding protein